MCGTLKGRVRLTLGLEFDLGLELDSAEVRGILLYNNQEWGRFAGFRHHYVLALTFGWQG